MATYDISEIDTVMGNLLDQFTKNMVVGIADRIIIKVPVDTGALRGSVTVAVGSPNTEFDENNKDPGGDATRQKVRQAVAEGKPGDTYHVTVNAPYAGYLEEGTEHIPPMGFVRTTLEELDAIAAESARNLEK